MKNLLLAAFILVGLGAAAQDYKGHYGVGLVIGEPLGLSIKKFNSNERAFQYTLGYSFVDGSQGLNIGADYLLHNYELITAEKGNIPFYYGLGAHLKSYVNSGNQLYVRVPLGVAYELNDLPIDLFFEFAPGISLLRTSNEYELIETNFGIGGRFYFDHKKAAEAVSEVL